MINSLGDLIFGVGNSRSLSSTSSQAISLVVWGIQSLHSLVVSGFRTLCFATHAKTTTVCQQKLHMCRIYYVWKSLFWINCKVRYIHRPAQMSSKLTRFQRCRIQIFVIGRVFAGQYYYVAKCNIYFFEIGQAHAKPYNNVTKCLTLRFHIFEIEFRSGFVNDFGFSKRVL